VHSLFPAPDEHHHSFSASKGHESVYTQAYPLLKRCHVPVTLFIYPSAISNASYALTWSQLRKGRESGPIFLDISVGTGAIQVSAKNLKNWPPM
jgi:hypothetical protein